MIALRELAAQGWQLLPAQFLMKTQSDTLAH
jgi:hypothetical protein